MAQVIRKYKPGLMGRMSDARTIPLGGFGGKGYDLISKKIRLEVLEVPYITEDVPSFPQSNMVFSYFISRFYSEIGEPNLESKELIGAVVGIMLNCIDRASYKQLTELYEAFKLANLRLVLTPYTYAEFENKLMLKDPRLNQFLDLWDDEKDYVLEKTQMMLTLSCIILVAMNKHLTDDNFDKWFENRVSAFSKTLADNWSANHLSRAKYPEISALQTLNVAVTANYNMRKQFFYMIVSIGKREDGYFAIGFREVFNLFKGLEMHHLSMIDRYLMKEYPEFKTSVYLSGLEERFGHAVAVVEKLSPDELMYARFILTKDEAQALNRNNFVEATVIATQIAKRLSSTYNNYYESKNAAHDQMRDLVNEYFDIRGTTAIIGLGLQQRESRELTTEEKVAYLKQASDRIAGRAAAVEIKDELDDLIDVPIGKLKTILI